MVLNRAGGRCVRNYTPKMSRKRENHHDDDIFQGELLGVNSRREPSLWSWRAAGRHNAVFDRAHGMTDYYMWTGFWNCFRKSSSLCEKYLLSCTFACSGPGVSLMIKILAEMESSDDLRSELCRLILSGSVWVKSYDRTNIAKCSRKKFRTKQTLRRVLL